MKKTLLISSMLTALMTMQGCAPYDPWSGGCPKPTPEQLQNGYLIMQEGVTKKCQIMVFTSNMPCGSMQDSDGTDNYICNPSGKILNFTFDDQGILTKYKQYP